MEELQVPTRRILVEAFLSCGEQLRGSLYLTESPYHSPGPEDIGAVLNDERSFLPFTTDESSGSAVLNKLHVLRVHVGFELTDSEAFDPGGSRAACTLLLDDGTRLTGKVAIATPMNSSRLVDKMNHAPRFIPVITSRGIDFVHTLHIVRVH